MDELDIARTLVLWFWALGLAGIEIEMEGGWGWAERMPTWFKKRGAVGKVYGVIMGGRPLTGYHVYAFSIPFLLLHLPFVNGLDWTLGGEIAVIATYFALAVVWDYLWFVLNPSYTVKRFQKGNVWWFEVPWLWRFPRDYYLSIALSIVLAGVATLVADSNEHINRHLWMLAGLFLLTGLAILAAPAYGRWYRRMRAQDDRPITHTYPPPAPEETWASGMPDTAPLEPPSQPDR